MPELYAGTVTIGRKWIGMKSAQEQYDVIKQKVRKYMGYHRDYRYYFIFEFQKNGQLHAHTVYYNMYQNMHIETFGDFGSRNSNKASFKKINNFEKYWTYIHKDQDKMFSFPPIHNVMKKDIPETKDE